MTPLDYWRSGAGLGNITPKGKPWPEGDDFPEFLSRLIGRATVLEFGCGTGRLAMCLEPERYVGVDVSPAALEIARQTCPTHRFELIEAAELPDANVTLCHTVLLHVPDADLSATAARFASPRVIVSEVMGRQWRRDGDPPVFNRAPDEYAETFEAAGYRLAGILTRPYPHYRDTDLTILDFRC